ncbi:DNA-directed RNA polymerase III subunit RPC6-like isoform X1 [Xenia sp. Carnegie-2017]|uniref:DNA-directed RNA polymerase III subunit RPC6-like isoform X1 n=1 Tax=Xenia sp. Carnegie-2017 TaxID=2897299 RepID=UPI001F03C4B1|nr:DNA-directed RNA polymerase III subunit RPC6-like isoform X1 [Xenia sp. Carnegie-2017]
MAVADIVVKQESIEAVDLESKILALCQENAKGITDVVIQQSMPNVPAQQRVMAINRLLSTGRLELLKSGSTLLYRYKDAETVSLVKLSIVIYVVKVSVCSCCYFRKVKGFDLEEKLVYQIIEEAANKGIWIRDIRYKSNLQLAQVNKILKTLESKKLIKAIKSVAASKKKVYMLFNLEPDQSITGGSWYSNQEFESEFVDVLNQQCFKFLQQKAAEQKKSSNDPLVHKNASYGSSEEISNYITNLGISKVQLSVTDIETILDTLVFDGKLEMTTVNDKSSGKLGDYVEKKMYRAVKPIISSTGFVRVPCGVCPVIDKCNEKSAISPRTCIYMKEWLK